MDSQMVDKPDNFDRIDKFIEKLKQKNKPQNLKVRPLIVGTAPLMALLRYQTPLNGSFLHLAHSKGKQYLQRPQTPAGLIQQSLV